MVREDLIYYWRENVGASRQSVYEHDLLMRRKIKNEITFPESYTKAVERLKEAMFIGVAESKIVFRYLVLNMSEEQIATTFEEMVLAAKGVAAEKELLEIKISRGAN